MASRDSWSGWIGFAGIVLLVIGALDVLQGFVAILEDEYVVATSKGLAIVDVTAWGWIALLWGVLLIFAGLGSSRGGELGALARHRRRGPERDPADHVPGELPAGVSALEHLDRHAERHRVFALTARWQGYRDSVER